MTSPSVPCRLVFAKMIETCLLFGFSNLRPKACLDIFFYKRSLGLSFNSELHQTSTTALIVRVGQAQRRL